MPKDKETYIHRIGRTGRFGRKGAAINFITTTDKIMLQKIEETYSIKIEDLPIDLSNIL